MGSLLLSCCLPGCTGDEKSGVGAPCMRNSDCATGTCATEAEGFPGGYCSGSCTVMDRHPLDDAGCRADCKWSMGSSRWLATDCLSRPGYGEVEGLLLPTCRPDDDCRGCDCWEGTGCSIADGWRCNTLPGIGERCLPGYHECFHQCVLTADGTGICTDGSLQTTCYSSLDCGLPANCTQEATFVRRCDSYGENLDIRNVCYDSVVPPLVEGTCIRGLGAPCFVNEDCLHGECMLVSTENRCTARCSDDSFCRSVFELDNAACCTNLTTGSNLCMYSDPGDPDCSWYP